MIVGDFIRLEMRRDPGKDIFSDIRSKHIHCCERYGYLRSLVSDQTLVLNRVS